MSASPRLRLRQAVMVAGELEPVAAILQDSLDLSDPFCDPGVAEFGVTNAVFALGDCFLEVISPTRPGTAAGRYLDRHGGDGGYMVIFDLEDLEGARARAQQLGIRTVWQIDLDDISGTHLHPADMHGAIVSLDQSRPYGTWRWGGPSWTGTPGRGGRGRLVGATIAVADPAAVAERWGYVLGAPVLGASQPQLHLDDADLHFRQADEAAQQGLVEISIALPPPLRQGHDVIDAGGVRLRLLDD